MVMRDPPAPLYAWPLALPGKYADAVDVLMADIYPVQTAGTQPG